MEEYILHQSLLLKLAFFFKIVLDLVRFWCELPVSAALTYMWGNWERRIGQRRKGDGEEGKLQLWFSSLKPSPHHIFEFTLAISTFGKTRTFLEMS